MATQHAQPKRKRGRSLEQYVEDRDAAAAELARQQVKLDALRNAIWLTFLRFKGDQSDLIKQQTRMTRRPQNSHLTLQFTESGVIGAPRAEWRRSFRKRRGMNERRGQVLSIPIPRKSKTRYDERSILRYAHPAEIDLVVETERQLAVLRAKVLPLQQRSRALAIRVTMLGRQIDKLKGTTPQLQTDSYKRSSKPHRLSALDDTQPDFQDDPPPRPQFRNPDGPFGRY